MRSLESLPNFQLKAGDETTAWFLAVDVVDFHGAARFVQRLPYRRNSDRSNFWLVLKEGRGTCSTKHALLAQLAMEQGITIDLTIGIYEMTEENTPGVGQVLQKYCMLSLPEAHCYLMHQGVRVDVTRSAVAPNEPIKQYLFEETIDPIQIGNYKTDLHQRFVKNWVANGSATWNRSWEEIWRIREECIRAWANRSCF